MCWFNETVETAVLMKVKPCRLNETVETAGLMKLKRHLIKLSKRRSNCQHLSELMVGPHSTHCMYFVKLYAVLFFGVNKLYYIVSFGDETYFVLTYYFTFTYKYRSI